MVRLLFGVAERERGTPFTVRELLSTFGDDGMVHLF
jgi:hypothetical protein